MTEASSDASLCRLRHHGAQSGNNYSLVTWLPVLDTSTSTTEEDQTQPCWLVYASHALVNLALPVTVSLAVGPQQQEEKEHVVRNVQEMLRTRLVEANPGDADRPMTITSLCALQSLSTASNETTVPPVGLATGFSNGCLNVWQYNPRQDHSWREWIVVNNDDEESTRQGRAISALDAIWTGSQECFLATATSEGVVLYHVRLPRSDSTAAEGPTVTAFRLAEASAFAANAVRFIQVPPPQSTESSSSSSSSSSSLLLWIGSAAPRHNKMHVYSLNHSAVAPSYAGFLTGHEDWITSLDARIHQNTLLVASASQDARIRLWRLVTNSAPSEIATTVTKDGSQLPSDVDVDDDIAPYQEDEDEEGESRLDILCESSSTGPMVTSVFLEALLIGHEGSVTSVCWHHNPRPVYHTDWLLISSSMDRTILLWAEGEDRLWTPLTRVGSAGGILGGSVGSTLLGFCKALLEPVHGDCLIGHAYGGSLHVWELEKGKVASETSDDTEEPLSIEDHAASVKWKASPCVTGHFGGVTDLCWEASRGEYLLTCSTDQTCRLWAPVSPIVAADEADETSPIWVELVRPQVHGYDLSTVVSISNKKHPHLMVSGADEKEIRVFDAPKNTLRILQAAANIVVPSETDKARVERAYIPSLGLSNKASAEDGAEEDAEGTHDATAVALKFPLERDLGAVSLWPEVLKLFGHDTELYCLTSTLQARTVISEEQGDDSPVWVASSAKAREVTNASIRLWNVSAGTCLQVLSGGHKSTVATLAFSPDRQWLASSGKDRRLCLWQNQAPTDEAPQFKLVWAKDSAHKRIVWSVHFCPVNGGQLLASGSRDGSVKIWKVPSSGDQVEQLVHSFAPSYCVQGKPNAVTAVAFAPTNLDNKQAVLALGLESGRLELWTVPLTGSDAPTLLEALDPSICPIARVTRLAWRPRREDETNQFLACSSMDHGCRILEVELR